VREVHIIPVQPSACLPACLPACQAGLGGVCGHACLPDQAARSAAPPESGWGRHPQLTHLPACWLAERRWLAGKTAVRRTGGFSEQPRRWTLKIKKHFPARRSRGGTDVREVHVPLARPPAPRGAPASKQACVEAGRRRPGVLSCRKMDVRPERTNLPVERLSLNRSQ